MRKKFVQSLGLVLLLNLLVKPFWIFGIDRTVQNVVGSAAYGTYFTLFNFSLILNIILDLGINNYNNRNISQHQFLLSKHFSNIVSLKFILAVIYFVIVFVAGIALNFSAHELVLLAFLAFNQFLLLFILYLRSNLAGLHLFKTDSLVSVLDRILMIAICSVLLWSGITKTTFKIEWFVYAQTAAYLTTTLIVFIIVVSKTSYFKIRFNMQFSRVLLKKSFPYALLILLMAFYNRVDAVMLNRMLPNGDIQAGIYAQGFRILDSVSMFAFLFAGLLLPIFSHQIKIKENVNSMVKLSVMLLMVPIIAVSILGSIYSEQIIELLYHQHTEFSVLVFRVLILGLIPISTSYIFGTLLTANGSLRALNLMAFSGMILNIVLNAILIPHYFAVGSAITGVVTQVFAAVIQIFISIKIFSFKINKTLLLQLMGYSVFVVFCGFFMKTLPINWLLQFVLSGVICFSFAMIIKLFTIKGLYRILKFDN